MEQARLGSGTPIFRGRIHCARALATTLSQSVGRSGISEAALQRKWMQEIAKSGEMTESGWYAPPPLGSSVLAGVVGNSSRLDFKSLRDSRWFPSAQEILWRDGLLFVYCSNVFAPLGMPSDFSTTIYFGDEPRFVDYLVRASTCSRAVAEVSLKLKTSRELFTAAQEILASHGFANTVHSVTDVTPLDYGHSLARVSADQLMLTGNLEPRTCEEVSRGRKFINDTANWRLDEVDAYTVEPQIIDLTDRTLPKVTFHYMISRRDGGEIEDSVEWFLPSGDCGRALRESLSR